MKRSLRICFTLGLLSYVFSVSASENNWKTADSILSFISRPIFPDRDFNILSFGAKNGVGFNSTRSIQRAIDTCHRRGGGRVVIPEGEFYTGPLTLKSNVNLHISEGAVLKFSNRPADYVPFVETRWEGMDCINFRPLIYARNQKNIAVTGKGILDGQATDESWWYMKGKEEYGWKEGLNSQEHGGGRDRLMKMVQNNIPVNERIMTVNDCLRPQFINPVHCENVWIEGVSIVRAPFWVVHPLFCNNVMVMNISVYSHGPNNDGCDPESCRNVLIDGCTFDTGDDCIAIKSGRNNDGRRSGVGSENIIVRRCTMKDGHGGVVIGSEVSAGCRNVFVEDCVMNSPNLDRVIRIKSNTVRGGLVENLFVRNIEVGECNEAVFRIELKYEPKEGTGNHLPIIRNIELDHVVCNKSRYGVFIEGLDQSIQIKDIRFTNCIFNNVLMVSKVTGAENIIFENVSMKIDKVSMIK